VVDPETLEAMKADLEEAKQALAEAKADLERARRAGLTDLVKEMEGEIKELEAEIAALERFIRGG